MRDVQKSDSTHVAHFFRSGNFEERSAASTAKIAGAKKLYVLVTRKVSLTSETFAQKLSSKASPFNETCCLNFYQSSGGKIA